MDLQPGDANNQQKMKSKIELLKLKYLKKNGSSKIQQPKNQEQTQIQTPQYNNHSIQQSQIRKYQIYDNRQIKQKEITKLNVFVHEKQNVPSDGWSMKKFIEQHQYQQNLSQKQNKKNCQQEFYQEILYVNDPFQIKIHFKFQPLSEKGKDGLKDVQFQQVEGKENQELVKQNQKIKKKSERNLSEACKMWEQSPRKALIYLIFSEEYRENEPHKLELNSQNPSFPGIVKTLAEQFVFSNEQPLKESQKQVVYTMALQYFSPSPKYLSSVLIVCLVKMAPLYVSVYADQIIRKIPFYMQKIVEFRRYLLKEQLQSFLKVIEQRMQSLRGQGYNVPIQNLVWMLVVKPNSSYCHEILLTKNIDNEAQLFSLFCVLCPDGKQIPLSILYLKCIDGLVLFFVKFGIIEKVIKHLNQMKTPEVLYKPVKSLKLKLIKITDVSNDKKKGEEEKGFTNFINDKINSLKEVLENKNKNKTKADVYYNTQTGQYQPLLLSSNTTKLIH